MIIFGLINELCTLNIENTNIINHGTIDPAPSETKHEPNKFAKGARGLGMGMVTETIAI